jgi:MFS family permease
VGIPIYSGLRELDAAPRRFLLFIVFNVVSWQCIVGGPLILFARKIGMPESLVGAMVASMPLSMVLVVATGRLVRRWGPKPVMLTAWALRNIIACCVFVLPWAMARYGVHAGWYVLLAATGGFCLMRSIGAGGWFPWLHEVVPEHQRGVYFSSEAAVGQFLNVLLSIAQALILIGDPSIGRFLGIYAIGIVSGLVSLLWMFRVPGGRALPVTDRPQQEDSIRRAIEDRGFVLFVIVASLCFSSISWLGTASVLYMRDALHLAAWHIMALMAAGSVGVLMTIRSWGRYAEHSGSGRAMTLGLGGHALVSLGFLLLLPGAFWTPVGLILAVVFAAVFNTAFWMAAHRAMLNLVKTNCRVGYSNFWSVTTNLINGTTPILAGIIIQHYGMSGYRACFIIGGVLGLACAVSCLAVVRDGLPLGPVLARLVDPTLPVRTLARIMWICAGLHESNRVRRA